MRKKIGELLVESGAVTETKVRDALGHQRAYGRGERLGRILVSMGLVSHTAVARALATQFGLPFIELPEIPPEVSALVSLDFQAEHRVVPFRLEMEGRGERLHIAVEDPADLTIVDELRFQLRKNVRVYVAAADDIDNAISLARGEKLEVVEAIALEDAEDSGEMSIERDGPLLVAGGRFDPNSPPPPAGAPPSLEWELPEVPRKKTPPPPPPPPPRAAAAPAQASVDILDELLGPPPQPPPPPSPPPEPAKPRVPLVIFGGAAQGVTPPPPPEPPDFSDADLQVLDSIEKLAQGEEASLESEKVKPARMVAALIRLLIKKGVIREQEFLEELARK